MKHNAFLLLCSAVLSLLLCACANQGAGPDGGPYDEEAPHIVSMTPPTRVAGGKRMKFTLRFNELIKIDNAQEKVVVSPPQINSPEITVSGRSITVELQDSIRPNTTYTVDFSDAITDNNEGNPLGQYTYVFGTGSVPDSMEMSGHVLAAEDLEPIKGILVGLYEGNPDSAFTKRAFERVARTDGNGAFTIKGVGKDKEYSIFALQDGDANFYFSTKGEQIAFLDKKLTPTSFADTRRDTLWVDSLRYDSIRVVPFTHFQPDDIVLLAFKEANTERALLKTTRELPESFTAFFTAPSAQPPKLRGLNFESNGAFIEQFNATNDTLTYWIADTTLLRQDSLRFAYEYEAWDDSLRQNYLRTDTLDLAPRLTFAKRAKQQAEELSKWEKERDKRHRKGDFSNETPPQNWLEVKTDVQATLNPLRNVTLKFTQPLRNFDRSKFHLRLKVDTLYQDVSYELDSLKSPLEMRLRAEWRPGQNYQIVIDSAAIEGWYGNINKKENIAINVAKSEEFGTLFVTLATAQPNIVVQLLDGSGKVVEQQAAQQNRAAFYFLTPGNYYLRCFVDNNRDQRWTTGNWQTHTPPEAVYYLPQDIVIKANWDNNLSWNPQEGAIIGQKPRKLIKQNEKKSANNVHQRNIDRLRNRE